VSDRVIRVETLGKRYRIGTVQGYKTLRESFVRSILAPFDRVSAAIRRGKSREGESLGEIWALRDVSFEVRTGEVVGVIGRNGAGKTTLLKILARITEPTAGSAELRGRIGALLEVGTGFHPELTGRENIYLSGAILGMRRDVIEQRFDEIVDFSGVETFLDTPVKRYSTGMYLRLAFAVAAHLEPDVLIVDEVLAVGDAAFQRKCLGKMREVAGSGRTVLFVSHNMAAVRGLCSRVLLLDGGRIEADCPVEVGIRRYLASAGEGSGAGRIMLESEKRRYGSGHLRIMSFEARPAGEKGGVLLTGTDVEFLIEYEARDERPVLRAHAAMGVMDSLGQGVFGCTTSMSERGDFRDLPPSGTLVCRVKQLPLIAGDYKVRLLLKDDAGLADELNGVAGFVVSEGGDSGLMLTPSRAWGNVVVQHQWDVIPRGEGIKAAVGVGNDRKAAP